MGISTDSKLKGKISSSENLKGKNISITGTQGPKGDTGEQGIQGPKGDNGITPTIGDNGNWYLGSDDTGKPSRGIQGEQGAPGKDAPNMYKYKEILTADVAKGGTITIPCYYKARS